MAFFSRWWASFETKSSGKCLGQDSWGLGRWGCGGVLDSLGAGRDGGKSGRPSIPNPIAEDIIDGLIQTEILAEIY